MISLRCGSTLFSFGFQLHFITQNLWKFGIRLLIQSGIMGNNNRTRFYAVLLGILLVFCEIADCTICEFCGVDFFHLGKHVWRCKQRIQPVNHPTVDNPMRPLDTSISLTNDQYNGNHAHSIINEKKPLNVNSAKQSLNNQNDSDDCYMKECYSRKLCNGLRRLKAHQRYCKVLDLPELRGMFQQLLLQELIVNESDNISDDNNSDKPDNEDLHNNVVLKGFKLPRSREEWDSVNTHFINNMAIENDINNIDETAQQFQSSIYKYFLENFGSHENSNEDCTGYFLQKDFQVINNLPGLVWTRAMVRCK